MIDGIRLENDMGDFTLVLEDDFATHCFGVDPDMLLEAVEGYRQHIAVGESIRVEREAFVRAGGGGSWGEYQAAQARNDPEFVEVIREHADLMRKRDRENRGDDGRDYGDEDAAA